MKKWKYKDAAIAGAVFAGIVSIFFGNVLVSGKALVPAGNIFTQPFYKQYAPEGFTRAPNVLLDDQHVQIYPMQYFATERLKTNKIPLWNPRVQLGVSSNGTAQNGTFYPWNLLMAILPLTIVLVLRASLNLWIAGFFTFLYVRRIGGSSGGAYLAAVSFMLCEYLIVWLGHPMINAAVWLPVLLYLSELFLSATRRRVIYAVLSAMVLSIVFYAGHMETAFEVCVAWFLVVAVRSYQIEGKHRLVRNIWITGGVLITGVLLAALQIIPFFEWLLESSEFADRSAVESVFLSWGNIHQLPSLISLFLPNFLINPSQIDFPLIYMIPWGNFNEVALYFGILPLFIVTQGLWFDSDKRRLILLFGGAGIGFLCLAFRIPIFDWVNQLPVFNLFATNRWRLVFVFFMAIAAGLSLDVWIAQISKEKRWRRMIQFMLGYGLLAVFGVVVVKYLMIHFQQPIIEYVQAFGKSKYLTTGIHSRSLEEVMVDIPIMFWRVVDYFSVSNWRLYFPAFTAIVASFVIIAWKKEWVGRLTFIFSVIFLTALDLIILGHGYNPTIDERHLYPVTPAVKFLKEDRSIYRILPVRSEWSSNAPMVYGISEMGGAELTTRYYDEFTDAIDGKGGDGFEFFSIESANSKLINLMNVKYIVTTNKFIPDHNRNIRLCWQRDGIYIYENHDVLPRAFIVHKAINIEEGDLVEALRSSSFNPEKSVLLTELEAIELESTGFNLYEENVDVVSYSPERVVLRSKSSIGGMLVLSDAYYPGWKAYLNDKEIKIYRANGVMRAVTIPAGEHEVEFVYRPYSVYIGTAISAGVLFMLFIVVGISLFRNGYKGSPALE